MKKVNFVGCLVTVLLLFVLVAPTSLFAFDYEVGAGLQHYGQANRHGSFKDTYSVFARAGDLDDGFYVWGSYEAPSLYQLGQRFMSGIQTPGAGIGASLFLDDSLSAFIEAGYYHPKGDEFLPEVTEEVIVSVLRKDFAGARYEEAILGNYDSWRYTHEGGFGGRVGLSYDFSDRWSVEASYRFLKISHQIDVWNSKGTGQYPDVPSECGCLWQERNELDMTGFLLAVVFRF